AVEKKAQPSATSALSCKNLGREECEYPERRVKDNAPYPRTSVPARQQALHEEHHAHRAKHQAHQPKPPATRKGRDGADGDRDLEERHAARENHMLVQMRLGGLLLLLRLRGNILLFLLVLRNLLAVLLRHGLPFGLEQFDLRAEHGGLDALRLVE